MRVQARAGGGRPFSIDDAAEQDGDVIGPLVGDKHVKHTIAVDVLNGGGDRVAADGDDRGRVIGGIAGGIETGAVINQHAVGAAGDNDGVEEGTLRPFQLHELDGPWSELGRGIGRGQRGHRGKLVVGDRSLDGDGIGLLVGDDGVGRAVAL